MKPYYQDDWVTLYHGDCREILPELPAEDAIITDPIWPNSLPSLTGSDRPYELFREFCQVIPESVKRLVIQLGCNSDPRFLNAVADKYPFLRVCSMEYAVPSYRGRILNTGDFAYVFGLPPEWRKDRQLMPGLCKSNYVEKLFRKGIGAHKDRRVPCSKEKSQALPHPATRRLQHLYWLVHFFSDTQVVDPFAGSGTTLIAAKYLNRHAIGIEIEERFCELAAKRLSQNEFISETPPHILVAGGRG